MKIAFDAQPMAGKRTGIGNYTLHLIKALDGNYPAEEYYGIINSFRKRAVFPAGLLPGDMKFLYTRVPNIIPGHLSAGLRYGFLIGHECSRAGIDLFHGTDFNLPVNFKGIKIVTVHDLSFLVHPEFFTAAILSHLKNIGRNLLMADRIIAVSHNTAHDIAAFFPSVKDKVVAVYSGINPFFLENISRIPSEIPSAVPIIPHGKYILYSGTIEPRKNLINLIAAYDIAAEKIEQRLVITGKNGWMCEDVFRRHDRSKFKERIIFTGYLDDDTLRSLFRGADMFVYPSFYEGFGFPVVEAQASQIPVITSPNSSLLEVGKDSVIYADPTSPEDLACKIIELANNPEQKKRLVTAGLENIKRFNWAKTAEEVMEIYLKCFKKP